MNQKILDDLKKLKTVYYEEKDVKIGDALTLKLKPLTSEEETDSHAYAMTYERGLSYLFALKRDTLCKAIISLNGQDLPEIIEDNEIKDTEGKPEKTQRHLWIRKNIVKGWNQELVDTIWNHYKTLMDGIETKIHGNVIVGKLDAVVSEILDKKE